MLQPLTLVPPRSSTIQLTEMLSPTQRNRADSLVFSITSQKYRSPKDSILLESRSEEVCKELEELQYKLQSLEFKVQVFNTEPMVADTRDQTMQYRNKDDSRMSSDFEKTDPYNCKENLKNLNNVGKIVKKGQSLSKTTKIVRTNSKLKAQPSQSRNSAAPSVDREKTREVAQLRKAIITMKQSIMKKERSQSICSERLSASKSLVKSLQKQERRQEKLITKLRGQLKKANHIRAQQKEVILRQQQQIAHYRLLLKLGKSVR